MGERPALYPAYLSLLDVAVESEGVAVVVLDVSVLVSARLGVFSFDGSPAANK